MSCMGKYGCSQCYELACQNRTSTAGFGNCGLGLTIPGIIEGAQSGSVSKGVVSTITGTALSFVPGGNLIGGLISAIGSLFGAAPRGNLQKFQRNAYPYMRTLAAQSGIPVFIYWFGEAVGVNPDGSYGVVYPYGSAELYENKLEMEGKVPFYAATCPISDCVNNPSQLGFQLHDPTGIARNAQDVVLSVKPSTQPTQPVTLPSGQVTNLTARSGSTYKTGILGGMSDMLVWGGIAAAVYMLMSGRKRG